MFLLFAVTQTPPTNGELNCVLSAMSHYFHPFATQILLAQMTKTIVQIIHIATYIQRLVGHIVHSHVSSTMEGVVQTSVRWSQ